MNTFKILLTVCCAVLATASCNPQNKKGTTNELYVIPSRRHGDEHSQKYKDKDGRPVSGYINKDGQLVINLKFNYADDFQQGLARVEVDNKWFYINQKGEFVIKPQVSFADNFQAVDEKLLLARVESGNKWGFIDTSGNYVINPQFDEAGYFTQSLSNPTVVERGLGQTLAKVKVGGKWGFIDGSGNYVINPRFDAAGDFSEGLASIKTADKCGYIDTSGNIVIPLQFNCTVSTSILEPDRIIEPGDFSSWRMIGTSLSLARVREVLDKPKPTGRNTSLSGAVADISGSATDNLKYGYIDRTGKYVIEPQFDEAKDFSDNGLAVVGFAKNMTVLSDAVEIGSTGDEETDKVIREKNNALPPTKEVVSRIVKWGFINETGRLVINPQFDEVEDFSEGLASATFRGRCGYIDMSGKYVIEPKFARCDSFSRGVAYVKAEGAKNLVIDKSGEIIFTYYSDYSQK